jgi:hypothetical protein
MDTCTRTFSVHALAYRYIRDKRVPPLNTACACVLLPQFSSMLGTPKCSGSCTFVDEVVNVVSCMHGQASLRASCLVFIEVATAAVTSEQSERLDCACHRNICHASRCSQVSFQLRSSRVACVCELQCTCCPVYSAASFGHDCHPSTKCLEVLGHSF